MSGLPPPPLHSVDPADWWVFRDQCLDAGCPQAHADLLWRIARALELKPKLQLCGGDVDEDMIIAPGRTRLLEAVGEWKTYPYWKTAEGKMQQLLGVPSDYPELITLFPDVAWGFFQLIAESQR